MANQSWKNQHLKGVFPPILLCLLVLVACSEPDSAPKESVDRKSPDPAKEQAAQILSKMTLEEKIGQILQADISTASPNDARAYNLGSVLNGGNSAPGGGIVAKPEDWIALADEYWKASTDTSDGGVGIPLLWGTDAVHGHNNLQNATIFPHNIGLGAMHNPALIKQIGEITAREVKATGLDWTFAPTLAIAQDDRWGRTYESYSETPDIILSYAKAMVEGLQGASASDNFLKRGHILATAKHFVADGGTYLGIDRGDARGEREIIIEQHGAGYPIAIEAGVQTIMASFSSINGEKMHGSHYYLTKIIRDQMGFDGFLIGDWNGHAFIDGCTKNDCLQALHAGLDMYMAPDSWKGLYTSLLQHAKEGRLDLARLDEAVMRVLTVKIRAGLLIAGLPSKRPATTPEILGNGAHRAIARQAVRESLVLLKNNNQTLPIKGNATVLVAGSGAHSLQQQTGGWTLSWQGDTNANDAFETGETIFEGLQKAVQSMGGKAILAEDGHYEGNNTPDIAVVVYGEQPYAEYRGDRKNLVYEFEGDPNITLLNTLNSQDIPVVSVFLTGRPLWANPHLNASDAFLAAWLPGTEGGGIADVIIGDKDGSERHDFKGTLSFSWPNKGDGTPINEGDNDSDPQGILFPYGYGLTYKDAKETAALNTDPGVEDVRKSFSGSIMARGDAAEPFQLYLWDEQSDLTPVIGLRGASGSRTVTLVGTDYQAQEDARSLTWDGTLAGFATVRTNWPVNLSKLGDAEALGLRLVWRLDERPADNVFLAMACEKDCSVRLNITDILNDLDMGAWRTTTLPLSCFKKAGSEFEAISNLVELSTANTLKLSLHAIDIVEVSDMGACPAPMHP